MVTLFRKSVHRLFAISHFPLYCQDDMCNYYTIHSLAYPHSFKLDRFLHKMMDYNAVERRQVCIVGMMWLLWVFIVGIGTMGRENLCQSKFINHMQINKMLLAYNLHVSLL